MYRRLVSISGVLVMVSSELVVLLIVCVGINTGSAQDQPGDSATNTQSFVLSNAQHLVEMITTGIALTMKVLTITPLNVYQLH